MSESADKARDIGQQVGEEARGVLPVIGDAIEGFWDGMVRNAPDEGSGTYTTAYDLGAAIPGVLQTLWDFTAGFFAGLFG